MKRRIFKLKKFPSEKDKDAIMEAIRKVEESTSGEIRVYIERTAKENHYERALYLFKELEIYKTTLRNGVLIYVAMSNRKFVILGDKGINEVVTDDFWENTKEHMRQCFLKGNFRKGIVEGVILAGDALREYFPYQKGDKNELSNEISQDK